MLLLFLLLFLPLLLLWELLLLLQIASAAAAAAAAACVRVVVVVVVVAVVNSCRSGCRCRRRYPCDVVVVVVLPHTSCLRNGSLMPAERCVTAKAEVPSAEYCASARQEATLTFVCFSVCFVYVCFLYDGISPYVHDQSSPSSVL